MEEIAFGQLQLSPTEFYNFTYRQFCNKLNGFHRIKDYESRERLTIMRNIMFSNMVGNFKNIKKPVDIMQFDFEKPLLKKMSDKEMADFEAEIEEVKAYYAKNDIEKNRLQ